MRQRTDRQCGRGWRHFKSALAISWPWGYAVTMNTKPCPDCDGGGAVTRREFLKTAAPTMAVAAAMPLVTPAEAAKAPTKTGRSETLVAALHKSLTDEQRKRVCFPFEHPLRSKVDNNWQITDKSIAELFNADQQAMVREIFLGLHSPEYAERVYKQVEHDGGKEGFGGLSVALFGEPGTG